MFYHWQVEHPHLSRLEHRIPFLALMVYIGYFLFSLHGITISIREILGSLGGGMGCYLDIEQ